MSYPRDPKTFLCAVASFFHKYPDAKMKIDFLGINRTVSDLVNELRLKDIVSEYPAMPYNDSLGMVKQYHVAVVLEAACEEGIFLPTKVGDYMQCGLNIWSISPSQGELHDLYLDEKQTMLLITGPNMSGKSTYMRQVILIAIMNQIGCFVPADLAELPVFDQIFTRIGAADDLISGQSTFMVEMMESRYAIENGTKDSLILLDEIGRGTSTYDGMALAQAIIEYIHNHIGAFTLFSTHYHELTDLENELPLLKNVHVCAHEENGLVTFLHKIADGSADKSYGIHVAKLAQMPETLITRAEELLETSEVKSEAIRLADHQPLERFQKVGEPRTSKSRNDEAIYQMSLFDNMSAWTEELIIELEDLDIVHMTPMQALVYLDTSKQKIKEKTNDRTIK